MGIPSLYEFSDVSVYISSNLMYKQFFGSCIKRYVQWRSVENDAMRTYVIISDVMEAVQTLTELKDVRHT